jgi:uncharacterized membrane protein
MLVVAPIILVLSIVVGLVVDVIASVVVALCSPAIFYSHSSYCKRSALEIVLISFVCIILAPISILGVVPLLFIVPWGAY